MTEVIDKIIDLADDGEDDAKIKRITLRDPVLSKPKEIRLNFQK